MVMVSKISQYTEPRKGTVKEIKNDVFAENSLEGLQPLEIKYDNIIWSNILCQVLIHYFAIWGLYLIFSDEMQLLTIIYGVVLYLAGSVGITAGSHRLWSHRSYKAKWPLRLLLIILTTIAYQKSTFEWARDHRQHHKYSDTDADPHNSKRGFFYSHLGWQFLKKSPKVINVGKQIDVVDLLDDPFVRFQHTHYWILPICAFIVPVLIPICFWNETFFNAFCMNWLRFILCVHATFSINSLAHLYGYQPYDRNINPRQNIFVAIVASGEGWHNYHHVFPWDYRAAEFGKWNLTYHFINLFAKIGWAYDLKTVSDDLIKKKMQRSGDSK